MKKALVIIDMQVMPFVWKDYGGKPIYQEETLIHNIKILISKAREAHVPIFYILYTEAEGSPRSKGQPLWNIHPEITPYEKDIMVIKYHADSFLETELDELLRNNTVTDVIFCGLQTEYCIDTTVKRAFSLGFKCELASDAHSTYDTDILRAEQMIEHHNYILEQFASVRPTVDIIFKP